MIGMVDYGAGNLRSLENALARIGVSACRVTAPAELRRVSAVVVPGVGSFGAAVNRLQASGLFSGLAEWLAADRPFLGICLGMQLLFEGSDEAPGVPGWGRIPGHCVRLDAPVVPHIGWNVVTGDPGCDGPVTVVADDWVYFVHSYAAPVSVPGVTGRTRHGGWFAAAVGMGRCCGVQFHPEKSGPVGLAFLDAWVRSWSPFA